MTEKALENAFCNRIKQLGGIALKGYATLYKGIPDRQAILPKGAGSIWVEFKGEDTYYTLTPMQRYWESILRDSDPRRYFIVNSKETLEQCIQACIALIKEGSNIDSITNT